MKIVVYGLFALELAQTLMVTRDTYSIFATGFADFAGLDNLHLLPVTLPILGGVGVFPFIRPLHLLILPSWFHLPRGVCVQDLNSCAITLDRRWYHGGTLPAIKPITRR